MPEFNFNNNILPIQKVYVQNFSRLGDGEI